jgi:orotidine-5'-phosphate decarboxylase
MTAIDKLSSANKDGKFICIGLDTDISKIPAHIRNEKDPVLFFNKKIIEATSDSAAAYKINFAFYEKNGSAGFDSLKKTILSIPDNVLIIGDAKRGDIGNTSQMYADSLFKWFNCDAVTVNPYMGSDSVQPFLNYTDKLDFYSCFNLKPGGCGF